MKSMKNSLFFIWRRRRRKRKLIIATVVWQLVVVARIAKIEVSLWPRKSCTSKINHLIRLSRKGELSSTFKHCSRGVCFCQGRNFSRWTREIKPIGFVGIKEERKEGRIFSETWDKIMTIFKCQQTYGSLEYFKRFKFKCPESRDDTFETVKCFI